MTFLQNQQALLRKLNPPALTARNLFLLLACLLATHHLLVIHTTQENPDHLVRALVMWGGAFVSIEDQLPSLTPRPHRLGLLIGSVLIILYLIRTALILHLDTVIYMITPLLGFAFLCLLAPPRGWRPYAVPLIILFLLPLGTLFNQLLRKGYLSVITANVTTLFLQLFGFNATSQGNFVYMADGAVEIVGSCTGSTTIVMVTEVALIFLLIFPLRTWKSRLFMLSIAPLLSFITNVVRIALLALVVNFFPDRQGVFDFLHDGSGSLLFSGVTVALFASIYLRIIERQLALARSRD